MGKDLKLKIYFKFHSDNKIKII